MVDRFTLIDPDGHELSVDIEAADFRRGKMVHHPKTGELSTYEEAGYKLGAKYPPTADPETGELVAYKETARTARVERKEP